jgi:hypothetical protein
LLGVAALVALVALPLGLQINLIYARRDLAHTQAVGRLARAETRAQRSLVASSERTLTRARADEAAAATDVETARAKLAETGVEEHEMVLVLDETKRRLDEVEAQRTMADGMLRAQEQDLPKAKECVLEGNRGLGRHTPAPACTVGWPVATATP